MIPHKSFYRSRSIPVVMYWMEPSDVPDVVAIEQASFEFPWREEDFNRCLCQRKCIGQVAEHCGLVIGYVVYELLKNRIHILNLAVDPPYRRKGVGSQMLAKLAGRLSRQRRNRLALEIRESNLPAQLFFRSNGFRAVRVLPNFYDDTPEDAYRMVYRPASAIAAITDVA